MKWDEMVVRVGKITACGFFGRVKAAEILWLHTYINALHSVVFGSNIFLSIIFYHRERV